MQALRISLVQTSAGTDVSRNLARLDALLKDVRDTDLIALPEVFQVRGGDEDYRQAAEPLDGPTMERLAKLARNVDAWVLAGSLLERSGADVFNTSVLLDRRGDINATYRKIHLFEARLEDGRFIRESDAYRPGDKPAVTDIEGWTAGLAICYDLRFPELFRLYSARDAKLLFVPSNFTQRTGRDHWEVLVRARAIENQCYLIAPNQCGTNPVTGVESYGNSMAVGPWGEVLGRASDRETVFTVELDPAHLEATRQRVPALLHRVL